jgi:hypothetical protein
LNIKAKAWFVNQELVDRGYWELPKSMRLTKKSDVITMYAKNLVYGLCLWVMSISYIMIALLFRSINTLYPYQSISLCITMPIWAWQAWIYLVGLTGHAQLVPHKTQSYQLLFSGFHWKLRTEQGTGKSIHSTFSYVNKSETDLSTTHNLHPITYLTNDLKRIFLFSSLAVAAQLTFYFAIQHNLVKLPI